MIFNYGIILCSIDIDEEGQQVIKTPVVKVELSLEARPGQGLAAQVIWSRDALKTSPLKPAQVSRP
jgi:hypothetical protein